jgi:kynurenine formamidase
MLQTAFDTSYTALTEDGAQWLVENTAVRLIGLDYLSIAVFSDLVGPHMAILSAGIIPVEGLYFGGVEPGLYTLHCLPLKIVGGDGAPTRCILTR